MKSEKLRYVEMTTEDLSDSGIVVNRYNDRFCKLQSLEEGVWRDVEIETESIDCSLSRTNMKSEEPDAIYMVRDPVTGIIDSIWTTELAAAQRCPIANDLAKYSKTIFIVLRWKLNTIETPFSR